MSSTSSVSLSAVNSTSNLMTFYSNTAPVDDPASTSSDNIEDIVTPFQGLAYAADDGGGSDDSSGGLNVMA